MKQKKIQLKAIVLEFILINTAILIIIVISGTLF